MKKMNGKVESFMFMENRFIMEKIIRMNGFVFLVQDFEKKGFETYHNLGKDPDDERWEDRPNKKKKTQKKDEN